MTDATVLQSSRALSDVFSHVISPKFQIPELKMNAIWGRISFLITYYINLYNRCVFFCWFDLPIFASTIHLLNSFGEGCEDQGLRILLLEILGKVELSSPRNASVGGWRVDSAFGKHMVLKKTALRRND